MDAAQHKQLLHRIQELEQSAESWKQKYESLLADSARGRVDEELYRALFENSPFPMWEEDFSRVKEYIDALAAGGVANLKSYLAENREALEECVRRIRVLDVNRAAREFYGVEDKRELFGDLTEIFSDPAYEVFRDEIAALAETNSMYQTEFQAHTLRGEERTIDMIVYLAPSPHQDWSRVIVSFFDITDRKRLEEQLMQSQKLESLGRLAGGIAHDFNNLLMVITGYSDLLLGAVDDPDKVRHGLTEIKRAGERGADLTQQLLAFSRKQTTQPRALSLNAAVQESQDMLQRVIGEDIRLAISLDPAAWTIRADRGQMHQVLMNLVLNSREAMPQGGVLTIRTRNVHLGSDFQEEPESSGGRAYVLLQIHDTGAGMDERTRKHLFEPFFTTKGNRNGTGLGLATVFGIVTHNGGHISVESEPGRGATFSLYFPPIPGGVHGEAQAEPRTTAKSSGTVLVVEDQDEVRQLTCAILSGLGFHVLEAGDGMEALLVAAEYKQPIRLLVTDVIMPGVNGRELAESMALQRPEMLVIYMSGYTDRIMSKDGVLDTSVAYLQKPFTPDKLTQMVHRVLGTED